MNAEINKTREKLLDLLLSQLKEEHPNFVDKLEHGTPENFYNFQEAKKFLNEPIKPWTELLSSLLDLELGLDFLQLTVEQMSKTESGRELHFNIRTFSIYLHASLERLEHFVKKLIRKNVITDSDRILKFLKEAITNPNLKEARHTVAHGRFTGTNRPIGDVQTKFYWEPNAVIRLQETHLDGWHLAQENNRKKLIESNEVQLEEFLNSIKNIFKTLNDMIK